MTAPRVFVDSNLWLYLFLKGQDEAKADRLRIALSHVARPIISTQVINECCANLIRKAKVDRQALIHYGSILLERCRHCCA